MTSAIPLVRHCPSSPPTCDTCGSFDRISENNKEHFRFYLNKGETSLFGMYELPRFWLKYLHWFFQLLLCFLLAHPNSWNAQRKFVIWIKINFYMFSSFIKTASSFLHSLDIAHTGSARQFTPEEILISRGAQLKHSCETDPRIFLKETFCSFSCFSWNTFPIHFEAIKIEITERDLGEIFI